MFDPKSTKFPYPENTDQHYIILKKDDGRVFDENYPYVDKSFGMRFKQFWIRVLLYLIVYPLCIPKMGLKIKGRKNLRKYRNKLRNGAVTVSNHIHFWDYIAVMESLRPRHTNVIVWANNVRGENKALIRLVGGIPIPDENVKGKLAFNDALKELLSHKSWLHVYSEGSMWEYYMRVRPFKKGAAYFAITSNKPLLPLAFSFRKPGWIRKHIFKQDAAITLTIGEPLFPDKSLDISKQETDLTIRSHIAVMHLAGLDEETNQYEHIFNNSKKIN